MVWTLDPSVIDWAGMVINECANFPKGTHDDMVDSVTQALGWLRLAGLAERRDEHSAEVESLMKLRPKRPEPLYPVVNGSADEPMLSSLAEHLPKELKEISQPFRSLAVEMIERLPRNRSARLSETFGARTRV
jgi:hypothetical protein